MIRTEQSAASLWQDYLFLTKEMLKFVTRRDMEMFYSLIEQRDALQLLLSASSDSDFKQSPEGQDVLRKILQINKAVNERLQLVYNQACRQLEINQSYEGTAEGAGVRIDFQR